MANKILNLDLSKDPIMPAIIYGRIADDRMQTVTVNITRRDEVADLTGYKITFEGTTHNSQTKVFDTNNVSSTSPGLKKGTFDYTFPNMAFAVAGKYDRAYFSITKDGKRDTTADFDILVTGNADIDAPEAKTIITEYNKLVDDLQKLQKQNISDLQKQQDTYIQLSDDEFKAIQARITDLETQIDNYEKAVGEMTSNAVNAVDEALNEFKAGAFYTQIESDNLFAKKTDLNNVDNFATATQAEAEAGLATNKFMTPALVFKAIAKWVQGKFVSATEPQTILGNKNFTETLTVNDVEVVVKNNIPVKSFWGSGTSLTNSILNSRLTFGNILGVDPLHQLKDVPFTLNSGMYEATMTRDANLFFDVNIRVQGGGASTDYSDYYYISLESGTQTGGSGETKTDFVMLGANNGQRLNLSNTLTGKAYVSLKKGQKFAITVTGLRGTQKIFSWQFLSGTIEEL